MYLFVLCQTNKDKCPVQSVRFRLQLALTRYILPLKHSQACISSHNYHRKTQTGNLIQKKDLLYAKPHTKPLHYQQHLPKVVFSKQIANLFFHPQCTRSQERHSKLIKNGKHLYNPINLKKRPKQFRSFKSVQLCINWTETGQCIFGDKCSFAHGEHELRKKNGLKTNYKTKLCKQFMETMFCPYGSRCQFIHNPYSYEKQKKLPYKEVLRFNEKCIKERAGPIVETENMVDNDNFIYISAFSRKRLRVFTEMWRNENIYQEAVCHYYQAVQYAQWQIYFIRLEQYCYCDQRTI
eukprot:TRINITY_DN2705_c0_g1_i1.p1 TRINITY_DN2705_c0_g1~~TRINITY_DN2705_c0_g1_i1.p1  ORF type:complete len:294 (+),score=-26.27 TRINITY_DN2705_c0_g1_i1:132-1013(+)